MKKLLITVIAVCSCTGASADSLLKTFINKVSNPGIDKKYSGVGRMNFGKFYVYKLNGHAFKTDASPVAKHEQIADDVKQVEEEHVGLGYDPVAIEAALAWQNRDKSSDDVMQDVQSKETDILYGEDSPLRDDAVTAAWAKVHALEKRLQEHRAYMKSVVKTKNSVSRIKEDDPK